MGCSLCCGCARACSLIRYASEGNPDTRDCLAAFLIGAGNNSFFSGPDGWEIEQSAADPTGIRDVQRRWRPEYDRPLGPVNHSTTFHHIPSHSA
jgi:hypothetical protein